MFTDAQVASASGAYPGFSKRGGSIFYGKVLSMERVKLALLTFMRRFGTGLPGGFRGEVPGKTSISLHLKAPDCEKIDILNTFFCLNFSNTMTTFMATFMATFMTTFIGTFTALSTLLWRRTF